MQPESLKTKGPAAGGDREIVDAAASDQPFTIGAASSIQDLRPLVLKHGDTFAVFDRNGDASPGEGAARASIIATLAICRISDRNARWRAADAAELHLARRQRDADLRSDQSGPRRRGGAPRLDHDLIHIRRTRFLWKAGCFERLSVRNFDDKPRRVRARNRLRGRFRRPVRGARARRARSAARLPRPRSAPAQATLSYTGLDNRRRSTTLRFDPAPDPSDSAKQAVFTPRSRPARERARSSSRSTAAARSERSDPRPGLFHRAARRAARVARLVLARRFDRNLQPDLQRSRAPQRRRSLHADDRAARGALSLRRHPLVQHGVRPRRDHHRAGDAVARPRRSRAACSAISPRPRRPRSIPPRTPSPARSCTKRATARWPTSARCRSAAITAASIRRRCS